MTDVALETRPLPLRWVRGRLVDSRMETGTARTLVLDVRDWPVHAPGQHVDVRLTSPDGYSAQRSYSIASVPREGRLELTVQLLAGGEVGSYLVRTMRPGDELELRGPIGGWFIWSPPGDVPVVLVAGGSGIVPLMAMLRTRDRAGDRTPFRMLYSVRTPEDALYLRELHDLGTHDASLDIRVIHTLAAPVGDSRGTGRITAADLDVPVDARAYICGPTGFVEAAARLLVGLGHPAQCIRTERFGPAGG